MTTEREFDVVVFGATGFTGGLVVEYLAGKGDEAGRWAVAGRNEGKLEAVLARAGVEVPIVVADVGDPASLEAMAARTKVVLTTVGPYVRYGEPVVAACVKAGASYVDITGEPEFVDMTLERYDGLAKEAGVRIVSCCGFDSIPHDLGAWLAVRELPDDVPIRVDGFVHAKGDFSGGTWHSAIGAFSRFREFVQDRRRRSRPKTTSDGRRVRSAKPRVGYDHRAVGWVVPMPSIDPDVVRRSARSLPEYGPEFRYGHYAKIQKLPTLVVGGAAMGAIFAGAQLEKTRELLLKVRDPGQGPSADQRARNWFRCLYVAEAPDQSVTVEVSGGDPGYDETAKMISESALCLAQDGDALPDRAGVLTTVEAMGQPLVDRLRAAGIKLEVVERVA